MANIIFGGTGEFQLVGILVGTLVGVFIWLFSVFLVVRDAESLRERGAKLTPWLWFVLSILALGLTVPIYLVLRAFIWKPQVAPMVSLKEGDFVLGKQGEYWYVGTLTAMKFNNLHNLHVQFDDGKKALLSTGEVAPLDVLQVGDPIFARPAAGGNYRPGIIADFSDEQILMRFEDGNQEWATTKNVRIKV